MRDRQIVTAVTKHLISGSAWFQNQFAQLCFDTPPLGRNVKDGSYFLAARGDLFGYTDVQACMCVMAPMLDWSFAAQNLNYFV